MDENMCVIGWDIVGQSTARTFNITKHYSKNDSNISLEEASKCNIIFICLPTTREVEDMIDALSRHSGFGSATIVIRVVPFSGYTTYLQKKFRLKNIVSNPEFINEATWEKDAVRPQLVVIGSDEAEDREKLKGVYQGRFKYNEPIVTDSITAETLKILYNTYIQQRKQFKELIMKECQITNANSSTITNTLESIFGKF